MSFKYPTPNQPRWWSATIVAVVKGAIWAAFHPEPKPVPAPLVVDIDADMRACLRGGTK